MIQYIKKPENVLKGNQTRSKHSNGSISTSETKTLFFLPH